MVELTELSHLREIIELKLHNAERALALQAKEYERRLEGLNHEASQLKEMQQRYIPREVYENGNKDLHLKVEVLTRLVYIAFGIAITLQFVTGIVIIFIKK